MMGSRHKLQGSSALALSLGIALPHYDFSVAIPPITPAVPIAVARAAEAAGFRTGWVSDHFFLDVSRYGAPAGESAALECWTTMTAVAAATTKLRVGSLVLCEAFRPPGVLAKMAATLDVASAGRLELGLGAGWFEAEYVRHGFDFAPPRERLAHLEDYAGIVSGLLSGSPYTFAGEHYSVRDAHVEPRPVQQPRPPIWVGGRGNRLLGVVARVADGWNTCWRVPHDYRDRLDVLARACERAGRDPATVRRSLGLVTLVGRDGADLRARHARLAETSPPGSVPDLSTYAEGALVGTAAQVVDRLGELAALGVEHVIATPGPMPFRDPDEAWLEVLATEVIPQI